MFLMPRSLVFLAVLAACKHSHPASPPARAAVPVDAAVAQPPPPPPPPDAKPAHIDASVSEACPLKPLPKGCPATPPNVNHPCSPKGIECVYVAGCCPSPVYVCDKKGHFEARFARCN